MTYRITSLERKVAKNGAPFAVVFLEDSMGEYKATIWKDSKFRGTFPNFDTLNVGQELEGQLKTSGDFMNFEPLRAPLTPPASFKSGIARAQETKAANIEAAQDRKHDAIKMAGAFRDATLISLAELRDQPFPTEDEYKHRWEFWVKWLLNESEQPFI